MRERSSGDVCAREKGECTPLPAPSRITGATAVSRLVADQGGTLWRVILVARLVSDHVPAGTRSGARLILRLECLTCSARPARYATARADGLAELDDAALRALASGRRQSRSSGCRAG